MEKQYIRSKEWREKIGKAHKGKVLSEKTRQKIRQSKLGHKQSPEQIAKRVAKNKGQKRSLETRLRMSESAKRTFIETERTGIRGEKNYRWKGGITPENVKVRTSTEYVSWRKSVYRRDGYACVLCNAKGGWCKKQKRNIVLNADHIKSFAKYPELRFELSNGRTLCFDCHKETDTFGNKKLLTDDDQNFLGIQTKS